MKKRSAANKPPRLLTIETLLKLGAGTHCEGLRVFEREWPSGAELTRENIFRAAAYLEIPVFEWYAERTLPARVLAKLDRDVDREWRAQDMTMNAYYAIRAAGLCEAFRAA